MRKAKVIALSSTAVGTVVLIATVLVWREESLASERKLLSQLETGTEEDKLAAVKQLGELRSMRAAPSLLRELRRAARRLYSRRKGTIIFSGDPRNQVGQWGQPVSQALIKIGRPALPKLLRAAADNGDFVSSTVASIVEIVLRKIEPELDALITEKALQPTNGIGESYTEPLLQQMCRLLVQDAARPLEVRRAAVEALARIQKR